MVLYYSNKSLESPGINILALDTCESSAQLAGSSSTQMMIYLMKTSVNAVGLLLLAALHPSNDITKLSCLGLRKTFPGNMMDFLSPTISHHPVYCCVSFLVVTGASYTQCSCALFRHFHLFFAHFMPNSVSYLPRQWV